MAVLDIAQYEWIGSRFWVPWHLLLYISITGDGVRARVAAFLQRFLKLC